MSMYYQILGNLWFADEEAARNGYHKLTTTADLLFSYFADMVRLEERKISFLGYGNFCPYSSYEVTKDVITEVAALAMRGKVKFTEGHSAEEIWHRFYISPGLLRGWERKRQKLLEKKRPAQ